MTILTKWLRELGGLASRWSPVRRLRPSQGRSPYLVDQIEAVREPLTLEKQKELLEEFINRYDRGEKPDPEIYAQRFPTIAEQIRRQAQALRLYKIVPEGFSIAEEDDVEKFPGYLVIAKTQGGMGVVYKALELSFDRDVAIKTLRHEVAPVLDQNWLMKEARLAAATQHQNIVEVYHLVPGDHPYLIMRWVDGTNLAAAKHRYSHKSRKIAKLVGTLARAVHHAHEKGVIHCDLKPANILINREGWPLVADFGLGYSESTSDGQARISGTPGYLAPEQAAGQQPTPRTDVFGLGAILNELLTGMPPRSDPPRQSDGNVGLSWYEQVADGALAIERPRRLSRQINRDLEAICLKCLKTEPGQRYATARELAQDLDRFLQHQPVLARSTPVWEQSGKWCRRHPMTALAMLFGLFFSQYAENVAWQRETQRVLDEVQVALEVPPSGWTDQSIDGLIPLLSNLDRLDARKAEAIRTKVDDRFTRVVNIRLGVSNLSQAEIQALGSLIHAYVDCNDSIAVDFTVDLDERIHHWREVFQIKPGLVPENVIDRKLLIDQRDVLARSTPPDQVSGGNDPRPTGLSQNSILTRIGCEGNVALEATFDASWDRADRLALFLNTEQGHTNHVNSVSVSPNGKFLATASGAKDQTGEVIVWDKKNGVQLTRFPGESRTGVRLVAFTPRRDLLAVVNIQDQSFVDFVHPSTGQRVLRLEQEGEARSLAFSPDGHFLAVAVGPWEKPGEIKLWDLESNRLVKTLGTSETSIECLAFSPDSLTLASGGLDNVLRLWDLSSGEPKSVVTPHSGGIKALAFNPSGNGPTLATGGTDGVRLWNLRDQLSELSHPFQAPTFTLAFSRDGKKLALSVGTLVLLDSSQQWAPQPLGGKAAGCASLAFDPDDNTLFTGGYDQVVREWDIESESERVAMQDRGYSFVFATGRKAIPRNEANPALQFREVPAAGECYLQILRNGLALQEARVKASAFPRGPIKLRARREGVTLTFEIVGLATLSFSDPFPLAVTEPGVYGLDLPPEVGLVHLLASTKNHAAAPRRLEEGDHLYSRGQFEEALIKYDKPDKSVNEDEDISSEFLYKKGLCLVGLIKKSKKDADRQQYFFEAERVLKRGADEKWDRWESLANCQLWLLYIEMKQMAKADQLLRSLADSVSFQQNVKRVPADVRNQVLTNLGRKAWGINLFHLDREVLSELEHFDKIQGELDAEFAERVPTKIAMIRAYWLAGNTIQACSEAVELLDNPALYPVNRIMVLEEYCWILRQNHQAQEALLKIDETLVDQSGNFKSPFRSLLVERARIHVALGMKDEAASDIKKLLELVPADELPYRYQTGAYLILGFLAEDRGDHKLALEMWKKGFRSEGRSNLLSYNRLGSDFGSLVLLQGLLLGTLTEEITSAEVESIVSQLIENGLDLSSLIEIAQRRLPWLDARKAAPKVISMMIRINVFNSMWKSEHARQNARKLVFQELPLADYLETILASGAAAILRDGVPGKLSQSQEDLLIQLSETAASAYLSGTIKMNFVAKLGKVWTFYDESEWNSCLKTLEALKIKPPIADPLTYFLGLHLSSQKNKSDAKKVLGQVIRKQPERTTLRQLAEDALKGL